MPEIVEGLEEQFATMQRQRLAAQLGMWIFLGTELLLFSVLIAAYIYYRFEFPDGFSDAGQHVKKWEGLIMTLVLATADLFATLGLRAAQRGRSSLIAACLFIAALLGLCFLGLHMHEYMESAREGALPGEWFKLGDATRPGASIFFSLFWLMTLFHILHVTVGTGVLSVLAFRAMSLRYSAEYHNPIEIGTMYWHFVDIVWTFLFPLLYLRQ